MRDRFLKSMLTPFFRHAYVHYVLFCTACIAALMEDKSSARRELLMCSSMVSCLYDAQRAMRQEANNVSSTIKGDFSENMERLVMLIRGLEDKVNALEMQGKEETARLCASEVLFEEEEKTKSVETKMAKDSERRRREKERKKNEKHEVTEAVRLLEERRLNTESVARSKRVQEGISLRKIHADRELEEREQREAEAAVNRQEREDEARFLENIAAEQRHVAEAAEAGARHVLEDAQALVQRNIDLDARLHRRLQEEAEEMKRVDDAALAAQSAVQKKKKKKKSKKVVRQRCPEEENRAGDADRQGVCRLLRQHPVHGASSLWPHRPVPQVR